MTTAISADSDFLTDHTRRLVDFPCQGCGQPVTALTESVRHTLHRCTACWESFAAWTWDRVR